MAGWKKQPRALEKALLLAPASPADASPHILFLQKATDQYCDPLILLLLLLPGTILGDVRGGGLNVHPTTTTYFHYCAPNIYYYYYYTQGRCFELASPQY